MPRVSISIPVSIRNTTSRACIPRRVHRLQDGSVRNRYRGTSRMSEHTSSSETTRRNGPQQIPLVSMHPDRLLLLRRRARQCLPQIYPTQHRPAAVHRVSSNMAIEPITAGDWEKAPRYRRNPARQARADCQPTSNLVMNVVWASIR